MKIKNRIFIKILSLGFLLSASHNLYAVGGSSGENNNEKSSDTSLQKVLERGQIRICLDPDNMPFSKSLPEPTGLEVDLAQQIAEGLGVKLEYDWYLRNHAFRAMRQITQDKCDLFIGLPAVKDFIDEKKHLLFGKPFYSGGFAIAVPVNSDIQSFKHLQGKKVGVQMDTVPDIRLNAEGIDRELFVRPGEAFKALQKGDVDAVVLTYAVVSWLAKEDKQTNVKVISKTRKDMFYPMTYVVRKGEFGLLAAIEKVVNKMQQEHDGRLEKILGKYGIGNLSLEDENSLAKTDDSEEADQAELIEKGRKLYKQACYKCHGPGGVSGGTLPDVRKYKGNDEEFLQLVRNGKKTMPSWKDILSDEEIKNIRAYIVSRPK